MDEKTALDPLGVEGHVTVQLFDACTGKQVDEQSGKNFLSRALTTSVLRLAQRYMFAHQHPAQWDVAPWEIFGTGDALGVFQWMILTDSPLAEAPTTEHVVPGTIIGYSSRQAHTDTDARRGIINRAESHHHNSQTRWVMDFATDRGNGTVQSVCWGRGHLGTVSLPGLTGVGLSPATLDWRSGFGVGGCHFYEGDYWVSFPAGSLVRRLAAGTGALLWERTLPSPRTGWQENVLAVRGDHLFYASETARLIRHTISTNTNVDLGATPGAESRLALIGNILYITPNAISHAAGTTLTLRRYNVVTAAWLADLLIASLPADVFSLNIFPAGGNILRIGLGVAHLQGWYHDIDVVAGTITPLGFPVAPQRYLLGHGGRLKVWVPWQADTYLSGTMRPAQGMLFDISDMRGQFLSSRIRLPAPIVKDSTRTMKIIYDFNYT
ncbi:MAG: hypothetical protein DDT38_01585 [Firmicutes bacterium]|nr:hypothetical protein [candidate division NPL-UPA2 bacterium]